MRSSLSLALAALGVASGLALLLVVAAASEGPKPVWAAELLPGPPPCGSRSASSHGRRRPANRIGPLVVAGGLTLALAGLAYVPHPGFLSLGLIFAVLPIGVVVHVAHAFPSGRLVDRRSRRIVAGGYVLALAVYAPQYLFGPIPAPVRIVEDDTLYAIAQWAGRLMFFAVAALSAAVLAGRVKRAPSRDRPELSAIYGFGVVAMIVLPFAPNVAPWLLGLDPNEVFAMQIVVLCAVPVVFGIAMLRGEFRAAGGVEVLAQDVGPHAMQPAALERSLRVALGDPRCSSASVRVPRPRNPRATAASSRSATATTWSRRSSTTPCFTPIRRRSSRRRRCSPCSCSATGSPANCATTSVSSSNPATRWSPRPTTSAAASRGTCTTGSRPTSSCSPCRRGHSRAASGSPRNSRARSTSCGR